MKKQTKGLKDKLSARHKTMNQPDIMHDFGILGKWSESTLKANSKEHYYEFGVAYYSVKSIDNVYTINRISIESDIIKFQNKRYFFPTFNTISRDLKKYNELKNKLNILVSNYKEYKLVTNRLSKSIKNV